MKSSAENLSALDGRREGGGSKGERRVTGLTEAVVGRLEELRGWTPAALERLEVGFDGDRVVFPVRDRSGEVVGLLRYAPNPERRSGPKSSRTGARHVSCSRRRRTSARTRPTGRSGWSRASRTRSGCGHSASRRSQCRALRTGGTNGRRVSPVVACASSSVSTATRLAGRTRTEPLRRFLPSGSTSAWSTSTQAGTTATT